MNPIMTPAQINRELAKTIHSGTLGIFTIVSGWYQWYLPMFFDRLKKELPLAVPLVYIRGPIEIPEPWASQCKPLPHRIADYPWGKEHSGHTTAALRYVFSDAEIESFDFIHITDADMLLQAESPDLINQHMRHLYRYGLVCYSNYGSAWVGGRPKCPGVHFVTQKWWAITAPARENHLAEMEKTNGATSWEYDELMLGSIITDSSLKLTTDPILWAHHGVHLGDWRRRIIMKHKYPAPDAAYQLYIRKMLADDDFMAIVALCAPHVDKLKETFYLFKDI